MNRKSVFITIFLISLSGCSGLDFSHVGPDAENFHPKRIAVLPETVGMHESARGIVNIAVSKVLAKKGWYEGVVNGETIKTKTMTSPELEKEIALFVAQVHSQGVSDPDRAAKLAEVLHADDFFLTDVTAWEYSREAGGKICRVGLAVKLIDAANGAVIWKAKHELVKDYWVFKPKINDVADKSI